MELKKELTNVLVLGEDEKILDCWRGTIETFMKTVVKTRRRGKIVELKRLKKVFWYYLIENYIGLLNVAVLAKPIE